VYDERITLVIQKYLERAHVSVRVPVSDAICSTEIAIHLHFKSTTDGGFSAALDKMRGIMGLKCEGAAASACARANANGILLNMRIPRSSARLYKVPQPAPAPPRLAKENINFESCPGGMARRLAASAGNGRATKPTVESPLGQ
jgi:hypothetical protein